MSTDIFIKSYHADFGWLKHCLKSIYRHCKGWRNIVIVVPPHDASAIALMGLTVEKVVYEPEHGNGYTFQQVVKLQADKFTDADWIWYCDSDCVFTQDCSPETFLRDGKPIILMTRYSTLNKDRQTVPWQAGVEALLGQPVEYEFMRRHPFFYPSWFLKDFRQFVANRFDRDFVDVVSDPHLTLSEFNALGAYAYAFHRDKFCFADTELVPFDPPVLHQFFSYTGPGGAENKAAFKKVVIDANL